MYVFLNSTSADVPKLLEKTKMAQPNQNAQTHLGNVPYFANPKQTKKENDANIPHHADYYPDHSNNFPVVNKSQNQTGLLENGGSSKDNTSDEMQIGDFGSSTLVDHFDLKEKNKPSGELMVPL